jgi:hypothetical protein
MSWGSNYSSNLKKLTVKQNCVRSIFFVNNRQSASPYYQLLEILKFENIVKLKTAILTHKLFVNHRYLIYTRYSASNYSAIQKLKP